MVTKPEPSSLFVDGSSFRIEFRRDTDRLRASVTGVTGSLVTSIEYWTLIAREAVVSGVPMLLVVDRTQGGLLTMDELEQFIRHVGALGLEGVRTAYVGVDPSRSIQHQTTEILAREHGLVARVFDIESEASLWLRHGER